MAEAAAKMEAIRIAEALCTVTLFIHFMMRKNLLHQV